MEIAELSIKVRDDQTNDRADEHLVEHDSKTEAQKHRHTFVR